MGSSRILTHLAATTDCAYMTCGEVSFGSRGWGWYGEGGVGGEDHAERTKERVSTSRVMQQG